MNRLMCHVVAGYPDKETCLALMAGMDEIGVAAIEVQIPFSDPIADGETIMRANDVALDGGMTTADSFALLNEARHRGVKTEIYVMSYLQKVQRFGLERFCASAEKAGVKGLIVPDLPYDSPEYGELSGFTDKHRLILVPVLSPGMPGRRLEALIKPKPRAVYVTSQRGITGNAYSAGEELEHFVAEVRKRMVPEVMIGFGIKTPADVANALRVGDVAVIGSAIINELQASDLDKTLRYIRGLAGASR